jgi:hypothetical protein
MSAREGRVRPFATEANRSWERRAGAGSTSSGEQYVSESLGKRYRKLGSRRRRLCAARHASVIWLTLDDAARVESPAQSDQSA